MNTRQFLLSLCLVLSLAVPAGAQANKAALVQFYQDYLALVSAGDYVAVSQDQPDVWDARFDAIAQKAGFANSADALAAGEAMSDDADIANLRQTVAATILQQYAPYKE